MNDKKSPAGTPKASFSAPATAATDMDRPRAIDAKHNSIIESLHEVFFEIDAAGRWVFLSPVWSELTGYAVAECVGRPFWEYLHPGERERCLRLFRGLMNNEIANGWSEVRHLVKGGGERWLAVNVRPVLEGGTSAVGIRGILLDISDRKLVEEQLARSQERLSLVLAGAKAGIWDWDMVSGHVYYDERWKAILGYEETEIDTGYREWQSRWHPEDAPRIEQAMADYLEGRVDKYEIEYRLRHKDGSYRWILTTGGITRDQAGRAVRWAGSNIDITDRKAVEELLVASETKLRDFAQAVPDASYILDEDGLIIEAFGSNQVLMPLAKLDLPGRTVQELLPADQADRLLKGIRRTIESGMPYYLVEEIATGKNLRLIEIRTAPMKFTANGKMTVALVVSDITERRRAERMLHNAYRLRRRSDFINDIIEGKAVAFEKDRYLVRLLGLNLKIPACCCLLLDDFPAEDKRSLARQVFKENTLQALEALAGLVAWDSREGIGFLCRKQTGALWAEDDPAATANSLLQRLKALNNELPYFVGVSELHETPGSLKKMYQEARCAALAAKSQGMAGQAVCFRDAGVFQFLPAVGGREAALDFVNRQIGRLLEYDEQKGTDYLATLEEILRGLSVRETADKLYLHPKTLLFRRSRIQAILRVSIDSPETRLALALATKLWRLYK